MAVHVAVRVWIPWVRGTFVAQGRRREFCVGKGRGYFPMALAAAVVVTLAVQTLKP